MITYTQNLHTHTKYCDGKNTPEEMVTAAIELGFDTLGFSGHAPTKFNIDWDMDEKSLAEYKKDIMLLKEKYASQIDVLYGLEIDVLSSCDTSDCDYVIGSSHFLKLDNACVEFDADADTVANIIRDYFDGNGMKYAKCYFQTMAELYKYADFDIVGHFDIIAKHCESRNFFDIDSKEYQNTALEALHSLSEKKKVFEVNTGAIARGYRTTPYPAPFILKEMHRLGCTVILTADCHDKRFLNCCYSEALEYIKECGFKSIGIMKNGIITEISI